MLPCTTVQMVLLAPSGTGPTIQLQGRSLDVTVAGIRVSELERQNRLHRAQQTEKAASGSDAAFSIISGVNDATRSCRGDPDRSTAMGKT